MCVYFKFKCIDFCILHCTVLWMKNCIAFCERKKNAYIASVLKQWYGLHCVCNKFMNDNTIFSFIEWMNTFNCIDFCNLHCTGLWMKEKALTMHPCIEAMIYFALCVINIINLWMNTLFFHSLNEWKFWIKNLLLLHFVSVYLNYSVFFTLTFWRITLKKNTV